MTGAARAVGWLAAAVCLWTACAGPPRDETGREAASPGPAPAATEVAPPPAGTEGTADAPPADTGRFTLYFADDEGRLRPETRLLPSEGATIDRARRVIEALMEGPRGAAAPSLPAGCALRALYLTPDGTAYVDLDAAFRRGLDRGSRDALVAVWAVVDTLAVNFPEVRAVKILVEGEEVDDLGGHLDLSRPLTPDMSLVAGAPPGGGSRGGGEDRP